MKTTICLLLLLNLNLSLAKIFSRCEFARELYNRGISSNEISNWVCIAESESNFNTLATRGPGGVDRSMDHGPFLISDRYWCNNNVDQPGKICGVTCADLRSDDITASINCAKKIYQRHGYTAWESWIVYCQNRLPNLENCFENLKSNNNVINLPYLKSFKN